MTEDMKDIKESIESIKQSIKTLEKYVLNDYYNEIAEEKIDSMYQTPPLSKWNPDIKETL